MTAGTKRFRRTGIAALAAATGLTGLITAAPASALTAGATVGFDAGARAPQQPQVVRGTNQTGGTFSIVPNTAAAQFSNGDQILIRVQDADGSACAASDTFQWAAVPTVTVTRVGGGTTLPTVTPTIENSGNALCGTDVLRLAVSGVSATAASNAEVRITVSGNTYNIGGAASFGANQLSGTVNGTAFAAGNAFAVAGNTTTATTSNAYVTPVRVTGNTPARSITSNGGTQSISDIVLTESVPNGFTGDVCLDIVSGNATFASTGALPTATSSNASESATVVSGGVQAGPAGANTRLLINVTPQNTQTSTITVSALRLTPVAGQSGQVRINAGICGAAGGALASTFNSPNNAPANAVVVSVVVTPNRLGGSDRFSTAQIIAERDGQDCDVVIARADQFPDALAGSYLAGSQVMGADGAPILLVNTDLPIPDATLNAIRNIGARNVYLLGQTAAISAAVENAFRNTSAGQAPAACFPGGIPANGPGNLVVERIGGADRYETARRVAERAGLANAGTVNLGGGAQRTAILATGENFPDALAAGPMAYGGVAGACTLPTATPTNINGCGFPLILTNSNSLNPQATAAIQNLGIQQLIVTGGTNAVAAGVVTPLQTAGLRVLRLAGADRQGTATAIANFENGTNQGAAGTTQATDATYNNNTPRNPVGLGWAPAHANLARGDNFPDSLTGGPHAGLEQAPILLTLNPGTLSDTTGRFLAAYSGQITSLDVFGGVLAVSAAAQTCAMDNLSGTFRSC